MTIILIHVTTKLLDKVYRALWQNQGKRPHTPFSGYIETTVSVQLRGIQSVFAGRMTSWYRVAQEEAMPP